MTPIDLALYGLALAASVFCVGLALLALFCLWLLLLGIRERN